MWQRFGSRGIRWGAESVITVDAQMFAAASTGWRGLVKSNPLRTGVAPAHVSARPATPAAGAHAEDVVAWLNDASFRLLEARLARARSRAATRARSD